MIVPTLQMAKEDALSQLHVEKRRRADAEDRCVEFSRKMAELEAQLRAVQTAAQVCTVLCLVIHQCHCFWFVVKLYAYSLNLTVSTSIAPFWSGAVTKCVSV